MSSLPIRLTKNRLNAYLWMKHGLAAKKTREITEVAEGNLGVYGAAPTCYLSLFSRIPRFRFQDLDDETVKKRRLVRVPSMRVSPFLVSAPDLPMVFQATKDLAQADFGKILRKMGVDPAQYRRAAERIEELVAERPRTASELRAELRTRPGDSDQTLPFIISEMCHEGRLVRGAARGGWKSDRFEYSRLADWLPEVDLKSIRPEDARRELARRYFAAHGPATEEDFRWWSGLNRGQAEKAIRSLGNALSKVDVLGLRGGHFALERERGALLSRSGNAPRGVALLPARDAYLLAYAARERYLDAEWAGRIYDRNGNPTSTVFWNGRIAGIWDFDELEKRLRVKVAPLKDFPYAAWKETRRVAESLARAIGKKELILERCPPPRPLSEGSRRPFLSPLRGVSGLPV